MRIVNNILKKINHSDYNTFKILKIVKQLVQN